jgi:UDP-N-acetylglucosamine 2-epimerase (non-hydrolysing)
MTKIHLIAAARPNFMKIAPLYHEMIKHQWLKPVIVHTGQHYDYNMSETFFQDLELPAPDVNLEVGSGSHSQQTAEVMVSYEKYILANRPDLVVVVGDVNSTMACTLTAKKLNLPVAHLEAGLRSFDRTMPEEINRVVTDSIADVLWTPSPDADQNLADEGIDAARVTRVGNIMIDALLRMEKRYSGLHHWEKIGVEPGGYAVVTIHRPTNTDDRSRLSTIVEHIRSLSRDVQIFFPLHPRTKNMLRCFDLYDVLGESDRIILSEPLSYLPFMSILTKARLVVTDSGGLQEETTFLDIPCLTLRENTERPVTCSQGTNELVSLGTLSPMWDKAVRGQWKKSRPIEKWDGRAAERIMVDIAERLTPSLKL